MTKRATPQLHGVLNIYKPPGVTSRDVVNIVQRHVRPSKAGHAGTLDPLAEGVLVVCVGAATRLIQFVQRLPKTYEAAFRLGRVSDTDDVEGEVREVDAPLPERDAIARCLPQFEGQVRQRPPAYSAIKVDGRRSYALAREGKAVSLAEREVRIDAVQLQRWEPPSLALRIDCGSGVYIRSIGRDLGERLGCGAVMTALKRTAIGEFHHTSAVPPSDLQSVEDVADRLLPLRTAVGALRTVNLSEDALARLGHGQVVDAPDGLHSETSDDEPWAGLDNTGQLRSVVTVVREGKLRATINLPRRDES